jgi:hypothetical protein
MCNGESLQLQDERKGGEVKTTAKKRDSLPNMLPLRSPPFKDEIAADVIPL